MPHGGEPGDPPSQPGHLGRRRSANDGQSPEPVRGVARRPARTLTRGTERSGELEPDVLEQRDKIGHWAMAPPGASSQALCTGRISSRYLGKSSGRHLPLPRPPRRPPDVVVAVAAEDAGLTTSRGTGC